MKRTPRPPARRGFSLIELLVSMAIGLVLTLAITSVLTRSESTKRSTTAVNDTNQSGAYAAYVLDRVIRSAGSGYAQRWREMFGCALVGRKGSTPLTWKSAVWTDAGYGTQQRVLAPVLIGKDQADKTGQTRGDLITVMAGTAGYAEAPQAIVSTFYGASSQVNVASTVGYRADDLILLADPTVAAGCMVEQMAAPTSGGGLPLTGTYALGSGSGAGGSTVSVSSFGTGSFVAQLGNANAANNNAPEFLTFGVMDNNVLGAYDLLETTSATPTEIGEGVVEMHAVYGIDKINAYTGKVDQWVDPGTAPYDIATLTGTNRQTWLRNIIAIRVGMVLRTSLPEKDVIAQPRTLNLFSDLPGLARTRTLAGADLNYRFRTVEMTIPLRNVTLAP